MKRILQTILLSFFLTSVGRGAAQTGLIRQAVVSVADNRLAISWGNRPRIAGGLPEIEGESVSPGSSCAALNDSTFSFQVAKRRRLTVVSRMLAHENVVSLFLITNGNKPAEGNDYIGLFFKLLPDYKQGVCYWFMQDWNAWTKPMKVQEPGDFPDHGVQFFLWQYKDGTYGAAMPLSGSGYETSLGRSGDGIGAKSVSGYSPAAAAEIPMLAVGFGTDPYKLVSELYHDGLAAIGKGSDLRTEKKFPEVFDYFGWCSWNASDLGRELNSHLLIESANSFHENGFPLKWMIADDGWLQKDSVGALTSYRPDTTKFPQGFAPVIRMLKKNYGVKYFGVWHTINGYWNGIDSSSLLGRSFDRDLFSWTEKNRQGKTLRFHFVSPYTDALTRFYGNWYRYLRGQGVDFVKVDNQISVPQMARDNFPVFQFAGKIHSTLNREVKRYFHNAMINCMDMANDAYYNFGSTAVARGEEDYFPYEPGESYNMMRGNAAVHVLNCITNSLWFGEMVYPDYDEFESYNPNAVFHAIARAMSDGPVYVTDKPGMHKFQVLWPLVYRNGKIIRTDFPARPTKDCLFQVQDPRPFKAFSMSGKIGLIGIWNVADTDSVSGAFRPSDVYGIKGRRFFVYEYFSKSHAIVGRDEEVPVKLGRMGYRLYYVSPINDGFAPIGLSDKYNAPGAIESVSRDGNVVSLRVGESGPFIAYSSKRPEKVTVDGVAAMFEYSDGIISLDMRKKLEHPVIRITF